MANVTDRYKGGGRAKFSPKTALRNVSMIPYFVYEIEIYENEKKN